MFQAPRASREGSRERSRAIEPHRDAFEWLNSQVPGRDIGRLPSSEPRMFILGMSVGS